MPMQYVDADEIGALFGGRLRRLLSRRRSRGATRRTAAATAGRRIVAGRQRVQVFGLGSVAVAIGPGTAFVLDAVVQKPTQFDRMIVGATDLGATVIDNLRIGTRSQLAGVEGLPAAMFQADAAGAGIAFDPCSTGVTVTVNGTNNSGNINTVAIGFYGAAAQ